MSLIGYRGHYREGEAMRYSGIERRKHERFKAAIPVSIGLINLKKEEAIEGQFTGVTMDISMEGLGLELKYPKAGKFPFGDRLMGEEREFDVEINAKVGRDNIRSIGEVRWASTPSPSVMKMGVFLKEIIEGETETWRNFVISQSRSIPRWASSR
jgi:hypothetical protein